MNNLRMKDFWLALAMTLSFTLSGCNDQPANVSALNPGAGGNERVEDPGTDPGETEPGTPGNPDGTEVKDELECEARATEAVPGESKNQGLVLWTHVKGTCNDGAYSFEIRSWGPVLRLSNEEVKIKCKGETVHSLDDYVGAYYGGRVAAGAYLGGSYGHYHKSGDHHDPGVHCNVTGHTDIDEDHWSFGIEAGYGRMTITKSASSEEPTPEPTPVPTLEPSPEPTDGDGPVPPEQPPTDPVGQ